MKQYIVDAFTDKPFSGNPAAVFAPNKQGVVRIFDSYSQELVFTDKTRIIIQAIRRIEKTEDDHD